MKQEIFLFDSHVRRPRYCQKHPLSNILSKNHSLSCLDFGREHMSTVINAVAKLDRGNPKLILGLAWMFSLCWVGLAWMFALAQGTRSMREGERRHKLIYKTENHLKPAWLYLICPRDKGLEVSPRQHIPTPALLAVVFPRLCSSEDNLYQYRKNAVGPHPFLP